jgi:hypothetical protein
LIFQANLESYLCSLIYTSQGMLVSPMTITWNDVNTLLHLFGFCNRSSFHQCSTECLLSLETSPDTELVSGTLKFLRDTLNIWYNNYALVCFWEERWVLVDGPKMEIMNFCGYSLSIRWYIMFLISLSKSFWS